MSKRIEIFADFDGTISTVDSLQHLLTVYTGEAWQETERQVREGAITEKEGLQREFDLLEIPERAARELVARDILIDPAFPGFVDWCEKEGLPLTVVSGGFRKFITLVLKKHGLERLRVRANDVVVEKGRWRIIPAGGEALCERCNHCKSSYIVSASSAGARTVFIGNGLTDRCPAGRADLIFAKDVLADHCCAEGIPFHHFGSFDDVRDVLIRERAGGSARRTR